MPESRVEIADNLVSIKITDLTGDTVELTHLNDQGDFILHAHSENGPSPQGVVFILDANAVRALKEWLYD